MRASVVIPTYNRRDLLAHTLDSVDRLDPAPETVVVVSDGSADGTDEMVRARGLTLLHTNRAGAAGARNAGWRHVDSDVVAFIDDDCVADPDWLGHLVAPFDDDAVGLVQGCTQPIGPRGRFDRSIDVASEYGLYESCNIAYRRAALEQTDGFNEHFLSQVKPRGGGATGGGGGPFGEDTDIAWRVQRAGWQTAFTSEAVVRHAVFPGTLREALTEEWRKGNFPLLLQEIPELAALLPGGPYCIRRHSPLAQAALAGLVLALAGRRGAGTALMAPYAVWLARRGSAADALDQMARDTVCSVGMLVGSVRARRLLI